MEKKVNKVKRRMALRLTALGLLSALPGVARSREVDSERKTETVRMITPDGKLVEVDPTHIARRGKRRVSNGQLLRWIRRR